MIYYYILSLLIITLVILAIYYIYTVYTSVPFKNGKNEEHLYYMSYEETVRFLESDEDRYVANLSPIDLYARKVSSKEEYINIIKGEATHFNKGDKLMLDKCTKKADELLRNININTISSESNLDYSKYLNYKDIANIKWVLAITRNDNGGKYEDGLSHTRKHIIFLSQDVLNYSEDEIIKLLIHEKIHIYQRYNEASFKTIIYNMGYAESTDSQEISQDKLKYVRSNPDVNNKIYKNLHTGELMICLYSSDKPKNINDIIIENYAMEHPYEKIAYEISEHIYNIHKIEKYRKI
uniref:Uncharacterized protein n=1 Tax=viral metagenome TaxID=1070528 RepID=A0A6C0LD16_9ZZZZ